MSCKDDPASPSSGTGAGQPCDGGVTPCPFQCKPISKISINSLKFLSDHDLLKDNDTDWRDGGARFPKPEWTPAKHDPLSHSMDLAVSVEIELLVEPPDACTEVGDIRGEGPGGLVFEKTDVSFAPGKHMLQISTTQKLEKKIQALNFQISWSTSRTSAALSTNTSDTIYITVDKPRDSEKVEYGVTIKRMRKAVELVAPMNSTNPQTVMHNLMKMLPYYVLSSDPAVPSKFKHPKYFNTDGGAWPIADFMNKYAECQAIVRFSRKIIKQLGFPGDAMMVYVYADPAVPSVAKEDLEGTPKPALWHHLGFALVDDQVTAADVGKLYPPSHSKMSNGKVSMGFNAYEACLKFTAHDGSEGKNGPIKTYYYPGGTGGSRTESLDNVLKHSFFALVKYENGWYPNDKDPNKVVGIRIVEIVKIYRP